MRRTLLLALVLILLSNCLSCVIPDKTEHQNSTIAGIYESKNATGSLTEEPVRIDESKQKLLEKQDKVPAAFTKIDFRNFTYPSFHLEINFRLQNGEAENEKERWSASFGAVKYFDLTNDNKEEALVELAETSVGVSSYTSFSYYIYTIHNAKPILLWKFSTGSESDCGHKQIQVNDKKIALEVFGTCRLNKMSSESYTSDMEASCFTRFIFGWNGKRFVQDKREVLPYPEKDVYKYLYKQTLKNNE